MSVRTAILGRELTGNGATDAIGTCPAGETWIIKGAEVSNAGGTTVSVQLYIETADQSVRAVFFQQSLTLAAVAHYAGWVVMEPGDILWSHASGGTCYVWVSGARLAGVA